MGMGPRGDGPKRESALAGIGLSGNQDCGTMPKWDWWAPGARARCSSSRWIASLVAPVATARVAFVRCMLHVVCDIAIHRYIKDEYHIVIATLLSRLILRPMWQFKDDVVAHT